MILVLSDVSSMRGLWRRVGPASILAFLPTRQLRCHTHRIFNSLPANVVIDIEYCLARPRAQLQDCNELALDRLRARAVAPADRQALQTPVARPLLGQQEEPDRVGGARENLGG